MISERDADLHMVQILDQTSCYKDMIELMKHVVELNPELTADERNLLSVSYKRAINISRNSLQNLTEIIGFQETQSSEARVNQLNIFKQNIIQELEQYCQELISIVDNKLLPSAKDVEAKVFYYKLKADYYRYISEAKEGEEKEESSQKAQENYEKAFQLAQAELPKYSPSFLGVVLNYSVFLYDVAQKRQEAIDLATKTEQETSILIEQNSEAQINEAVSILQFLRENISLWTKSNEENQ
ncbi:14-3-3 protein [Histomonas meleagridis]|uniref:14-3-3 protein n=1 Tax=Histomonas meleagridis TaxID=135588 RepID=UPI003559CD98|nr:14-3-3 protein [Histomonas meleagridis]KAH0800157.1 14-3-3 protein [Histomonas meleagridis]